LAIRSVLAVCKIYGFHGSSWWISFHIEVPPITWVKNTLLVVIHQNKVKWYGLIILNNSYDKKNTIDLKGERHIVDFLET
jgi:hypothetical protein